MSDEKILKVTHTPKVIEIVENTQMNNFSKNLILAGIRAEIKKAREEVFEKVDGLISKVRLSGTNYGNDHRTVVKGKVIEWDCVCPWCKFLKKFEKLKSSERDENQVDRKRQELKSLGSSECKPIPANGLKCPTCKGQGTISEKHMKQLQEIIKNLHDEIFDEDGQIKEAEPKAKPKVKGFHPCKGGR